MLPVCTEDVYIYEKSSIEMDVEYEGYFFQFHIPIEKTTDWNYNPKTIVEKKWIPDSEYTGKNRTYVEFEKTEFLENLTILEDKLQELLKNTQTKETSQRNQHLSISQSNEIELSKEIEEVIQKDKEHYAMLIQSIKTLSIDPALSISKNRYQLEVILKTIAKKYSIRNYNQLTIYELINTLKNNNRISNRFITYFRFIQHLGNQSVHSDIEQTEEIEIIDAKICNLIMARILYWFIKNQS